jgi:hypothetical protein
MKMNRLAIVQKYMSGSTKIKDIEKYKRAQKLSAKIIKKQDEKIYQKYYKTI